MTTKVTTIVLMLFCAIATLQAQTKATQFSGKDCKGNAVDMFADMDAGKIIIMHFFMPNCGSCPPPAKKIQAMANKINASHPGMVKGYAFPFQNSTDCSYASSWVSSNSLSTLYTPVTGGANILAYYGGFGMPTVVVIGGKDHKVLFSTLSFSTSDTTEMRDAILAELNATTEVKGEPSALSSLSVYPNPANESIALNLELKENADLRVDLVSVTGEEVAVLLDQKQTSGAVSTRYATTALPAGIYMLRINTNGHTTTHKVVITH